MKILSLSNQHHDQVLTIWESSVRATHHFLSEEDILFFKPLIDKEYLPQLSLVGITGKAGKLAGFLGASSHTIQMLFVEPASFGQGMGRSLVIHAIQNMGVSKVDVNEDNLGAYRFYTKMGFTLSGRSPCDLQGKPFPILHLEL